MKAYWFGIGVPYNDGYTYNWGFFESTVTTENGAVEAVNSQVGKTNKTNVDGDNATFYWGYSTTGNIADKPKWGYLVVSKAEEEVKYILDFNGLKFNVPGDEGQAEEKTVMIYNNVTYDASGNITALGESTQVKFTGKGTSDEPFTNEKVVNITTIAGMETHWFVTAVPNNDENMKQWLKIGEKWINVSGNQKNPTTGTIPAGHMGFGSGLSGDGEGTVDLCVSDNTAANADTLTGTFYRVKVNLVAPDDNE